MTGICMRLDEDPKGPSHISKSPEADPSSQALMFCTPLAKPPRGATLDSTEPGSAFLSCMSPSAFPEDEMANDDDDEDSEFGCACIGSPRAQAEAKRWIDSETQTPMGPHDGVVRHLDFMSIEDRDKDPQHEMVLELPATATVGWQDIERQPRTSRLRPEDTDFWELTQGKPPELIPDPAQRGVTLKQLKAILTFVRRRCDGSGVISGWYDPRTLRQLNYSTFSWQHLGHWILRPLMKAAGMQCCVAETLCHVAGGPQVPKFIASYWSSEPVVDFVNRLANKGMSDSDAFWVLPFATNLAECSRFSLSDGASGVSQLRSLTELGIHFAGRPQKPPFGGLEACFTSCPALASLLLDFTSCTSLQRTDGLGKGLLPLRSLTTLHLNFSRCGKLVCLDDLSRGLAMMQSLQTLAINMSRCVHLTSVGNLGKGLIPLRSLETLCLDFSSCCSLPDLDDLGKSLSFLEALTVLRIDVSHCEALTSVDEIGRSLAEIPCLDQLELNLYGCTGLSSSEELGRGLIGALGLSRLHLDITGCRRGVTHNNRLVEAAGVLRSRAEAAGPPEDRSSPSLADLLVFEGLLTASFSTPLPLTDIAPPEIVATPPKERAVDAYASPDLEGLQERTVSRRSNRSDVMGRSAFETPAIAGSPLDSAERTPQGWLML